MVTKDKLVQEIQKYLDIAYGDVKFSEEELHKQINIIDDNLVPNSEFTDIMFYGEEERTAEEMAEEALLREEIFAQGGKHAVTAHIKASYESAIQNPELDITRLSVVTQILEGIERRELPELRERLQAMHDRMFPKSRI